MSLRQFIGTKLLQLAPPTHGYAYKRAILRGMGVTIQGKPRIASSFRILGSIEVLIGNDSFIGHEVMISGGRSRVVIGACVDLAPRVTIVTGTHAIDMMGAHSAGKGYSEDVTIEDGAWIGAGATILGGVTIGRKAIVAAGSTVIRDIPPLTLAAGVPCRPKRIWSQEHCRWTPVVASREDAA